MNTIRSSIEYVCSSIGLMTGTQCETLLKLKKEIGVLTNRLYKNFLEYRDIFDIIEKENSVKNISKVSDLLEEFELTINNPIILKLIYGNIQDKILVKNKINEIYYDFETIKILNRLYKDYCDDKKYYDIKHLYDRPCSEALRVILDITNKNKEITKLNENLQRIISELKPYLIKNVLELKKKENYHKKEKKEYCSELLNNEYYLIHLYLSIRDNIYEPSFSKYDLKKNYLETGYNYELLDELEGDEEIEEEEKKKFRNIKKIIDQIIDENGEFYQQYLNNLSICFSKEINEKPRNLYLLIDNTNSNIIFSFCIDYFDMIYNLCKTTNTMYKHLKISDFFKSFLINQKKTRYFNSKNYYVYLDFNEPNFDKAIALFVRSGFSLKGPTSLPNNFVLDEYTKNKRYLLLSYNPKKTINYNSLNTENILALSNNIREFETKMKTNYYQLENFSIRKILKYLINWDREISGSFTRIVSALPKQLQSSRSSKAKINTLENLDSNMNLNNGSEMVSIPVFDITSNNCEVLLNSYDVINYHTHPLFCYLEIPKNRELNTPSRADLQVVLTTKNMFIEITENIFKNHLIFALECIYVIQIHPYWIRKFKNKSFTYITEFFNYLSFLIKNYKNYEKTYESLYDSESESLLELFYFYNNKFNFNELSKDTKHLNRTVLTEHPSSLITEESIRQWYKAKYYSGDLDRNMNLLLISVIPYNWREGSELSNLDFTEVPKKLFEYLKTNTDEISKLTQYVLDNLNDENIKIPYYYF